MVDQSIFANISEITLSNTAKKYQSDQALPLLEVKSAQCRATISLYGAQILAFKSRHKPPLLWLSPLAKFSRGSAIRGGIPLCAPWFGKHINSNFPNHGFARTSDWRLAGCDKLANGAIRITLILSESPRTAALNYKAFTMTMSFVLGHELTIEFSITNNGNDHLECGWAFHSYFNLETLSRVRVAGLDGYDYLDATQGGQQYTLDGEQTFNGEVDRYFVNASNVQTIHGNQTIHLQGNNCNTVITWNPGAALASNMADIGDDNYHQFVCVERGAAFEDSWTITPAVTKTATLIIQQ